MIKLFSFNHFYGSIPKDDVNISNDYDKDSQDENDTFELSIFHHNDHDVNSHSHANIISKKRSMSSDVSVVRTITIPITDSNDTCMSENDVSIIANTMNALLGVSIFAMPWGYLKSGVFGGSILVLIVGALSFETARVLLVAQKVLYDRTGDIKSYPEIAAIMMDNEIWSTLVQLATVISCIGGCIGYLIFLAETVGQLFSISLQHSILFVTGPLILLSWIRSFRNLSVFTVISVVSIILAVFAIIYDGSNRMKPGSIRDAPLFLSLTSTLNFLGPATFLFTIHYCVLSMGAEMLHDKIDPILIQHQNSPDLLGDIIDHAMDEIIDDQEYSKTLHENIFIPSLVSGHPEVHPSDNFHENGQNAVYQISHQSNAAYENKLSYSQNKINDAQINSKLQNNYSNLMDTHPNIFHVSKHSGNKNRNLNSKMQNKSSNVRRFSESASDCDYDFLSQNEIPFDNQTAGHFSKGLDDKAISGNMVEEDVERQVDKQDHFHHNVQESPIIIRPNAPSLTKPLVISYVLSAILICLLGAGGFMVYRNADISVGHDGQLQPGCVDRVCQNIILNLSPGWMRGLVGIALIISIIMSYIIILAPAREHIENGLLKLLYPHSTAEHPTSMKVIRASLVIFTASVAMITPYFGSVLGAVGGLTDAFQAFVLPPLIFIKTEDSKLTSLQRIFYQIIFFWGLCTILYTIGNILHTLAYMP